MKRQYKIFLLLVLASLMTWQVGKPLAVPYATDNVSHPKKNKSFDREDEPDRQVRQVLDPKIEKAFQKRLHDIREYGYFNSFEPTTLCDMFLDQIDTIAKYNKKHKIPPYLSQAMFIPLENYDVDNHPFPIPQVDPSVIEPRSRNYINPDHTQVTRVYSKTVFGPLVILHMKNSGALYGPEFAIERYSVAGGTADVFVQKYPKGKWNTLVLLTVRKNFWRIEADSRLEGRQLERFMQFAKELIESS